MDDVQALHHQFIRQTSPPKKRGPKTKLEKARMAQLAGGAGASAEGAAAAPRVDAALDAEPAPPSSVKKRRASAKRAPRGVLLRGASGESGDDDDGAGVVGDRQVCAPDGGHDR